SDDGPRRVTAAAVEHLNRTAISDVTSQGIHRMTLEPRAYFFFLEEIHKRRIEKMVRGRRNQHEGKSLCESGIGQPVFARRNVSRQRIEVFQTLGIELAFSGWRWEVALRKRRIADAKRSPALFLQFI